MKNRFLRLGMAAVALSFALVGCQTTKQVAPKTAQQQAGQAQATTGTLSVTPESAGFSPKGEPAAINLALSYGANESVKTWKLEFLDSSQRAQKTFNGDGSNLPAAVSWDGKNDSGSFAPGRNIHRTAFRGLRGRIQAWHCHERPFRAGYHSTRGIYHALRPTVLTDRGFAYHHVDC